MPLDFDINPPHPLKDAATLVPLFYQDGELHVLFTRRTDSVKHHKGQICLPGGMKDAGDESLWHTALREAREELRIDPAKVSFVCPLPEVITPTSFRVAPFVGFVASTREIVPNPDEIAGIFSVPLAHFLDRTNLRFEQRNYFGKIYPVPFFSYRHHEIWGATGRMILSLTEAWMERGLSTLLPG